LRSQVPISFQETEGANEEEVEEKKEMEAAKRLRSKMLDRVFVEYVSTWLWVRVGELLYRLRVILDLDSINRLDRFVTTLESKSKKKYQCYGAA